MTQSIYSATLIAEALPAVWERDPAEGAHNLERLRRLVRAAMAEMRTLLFELRPAALESAPLAALLERLGDALGGQTQIAVDIEVDETVDLPPDVKIVFYRVAQEAFNNIAKHARASSVIARVTAVDGGASLTVADDGRGFDPQAIVGGTWASASCASACSASPARSRWRPLRARGRRSAPRGRRLLTTTRAAERMGA